MRLTNTEPGLSRPDLQEGYCSDFSKSKAMKAAACMLLASVLSGDVAVARDDQDTAAVYASVYDDHIASEQQRHDQLPECNTPASADVILPFENYQFLDESTSSHVPYEHLLEDSVATTTKEDPFYTAENYASVISEHLPGDYQVVIDETLQRNDSHSIAGAGADIENDIAIHTVVQPFHSKQMNVVRGMNELRYSLEEYPSGLLDALNIETIRLNRMNEEFGGKYIPKEHEIQIAIGDLLNFQRDRSSIDSVVAHEIAHALHDALCGGNFRNDPSLREGVTFYGRKIGDSGYQEDMVPDEHVAYGPERVYPRYYGATNEMEYFATIVEFTLTERGIIQEGDEDYGSVLQKKQAMILDRIEQQFPGFIDFAEDKTRALRLQPHNEIHTEKTLPEVRLSRDEVIGTIEAIGADGGINGLYIDTSGNAHFPTLYSAPRMEYDNQLDKLYMIYEKNDQQVFQRAIDDNELYIYRFTHSGNQLVSRADTIKQLPGIEHRTRISMNNADYTQLLDDLVSTGELELIKLTIRS